MFERVDNDAWCWYQERRMSQYIHEYIKIPILLTRIWMWHLKKKKIWYIRVFTIFCHCPSVQKWFSIFLWKLICCNINRRHIFLVLNLSLCNHNSGWMSCLISFIYGFSPSCEKWEAQSSKWKYVPPPGIEPATPCFPACRSNHLAIGTVNDRL